MPVSNASFSFRMMDSIKSEAFGVIEQYGFTPSQVLNLFLTEIAKTKSIPINLSYLKPNATTLRAMADVENGDVDIVPINPNTDLTQVLLEQIKE